VAEVTKTNLPSPEEVIEREMELARTEAKPISRRMLVGILVKDLGLAPPIAEAVVEQYCDEKVAYIPEFLAREFFLPYVKISSLVMWIGCLVALAVGATRWRGEQLSYPYFIAAAVLFCLGGIGLIKALRAEKESVF